MVGATPAWLSVVLAGVLAILASSLTANVLLPDASSQRFFWSALAGNVVEM